MTYRISLLFFLLSLFYYDQARAQTRIIDSLKEKVVLAGSANDRLNAILLLCEERQSLHADTLSYYASIAKRLASDLGDPSRSALAGYFIASSLSRNGKLEEAMDMSDENLEGLNWRSNKNAYVKFSLLKGQLLIKGGKYKES